MNTNAYYMDGVSLPAGGVAVCRAKDLEAGDTGRDQSGFLHRWVLRRGLRRWEIAYRELSDRAARALLDSLPRKDTCILSGPEGSVLCHLDEVTHRCRDSLAGTRHEITILIEEC